MQRIRRVSVDQRGFTLIELVIIIAVLGIIAAVAIPKYVDMVSEAKESACKGALGGLRSGISIYYAKTALEFGLLASRGSDFHSPEESHADLGSLPELPSRLTPVWSVLLWGAVGTAAVVFVVSAFHTLRLAGGGEAVAEMVGARRVDPSTSDALERR